MRYSWHEKMGGGGIIIYEHGYQNLRPLGTDGERGDVAGSNRRLGIYN